MKNLVIAVAGDESLHREWIKNNPEFDLFVVYYDNKDNLYSQDGVLYDKAKGSKFIIIDQMIKKHNTFLEQYDAILIPDDDLYMSSKEINQFFSVFHKYELELAQPSILGWQSFFLMAQHPQYILRYTNWIEIMTPCFSKKTFQKVKHTFTENNSNWGIDFLWCQIINYDKIAVIDDVVAIHTRPCFYGDTYWKNNNNNLSQDLEKVVIKYNIDTNVKVLKVIERSKNEFDKLPSENKFFPNCDVLKNLISSIRKKSFI